MKLIVGLGNPGLQYQNTRHNIGFSLIDCLSERWGIPCSKEKWKGLVGEGRVGDERVTLLKPMTYMNLSGESVVLAVNWYRLEFHDLIVIYDDLDLPLGRMRLRMKGSSGGHNGLHSIIQQLGTEQIQRIKLGIDRPSGPISVTDYVLGRFTASEQLTIQQTLEAASEAVEEWIKQDFTHAMNRYNRFLPR